MPLYKSKPAQVEALQFKGNNKQEFAEFLNKEKITPFNYEEKYLSIKLLTGSVVANLSDYVVKYAPGEFVVLPEADFLNAFEAAE